MDTIARVSAERLGGREQGDRGEAGWEGLPPACMMTVSITGHLQGDGSKSTVVTCLHENIAQNVKYDSENILK